MANYGIALSGGGSKGAFLVGSIKKLNEKFDLIKNLKLIYGTSTGALIAVKLAAAICDDSQDHFADLENIYRTVTNNQVLINKVPKIGWGSLLSGNFMEAFRLASLTDPAPLYKMVDDHLDETAWKAIMRAGHRTKNPIEVGVTITCAKTGVPRLVTNRGCTNYQTLKRAVLGSAAVPILMPTVDVFKDGGMYVDGCFAAFNPVDMMHHSDLITTVSEIFSISTEQTRDNPITILNDILFIIGKRVGFSSLDSFKRILRLVNATGIMHKLVPPFVYEWMDKQADDLLNFMPIKKVDIPIRYYHPATPLTNNPFIFQQPEMNDLVDKGYRQTV